MPPAVYQKIIYPWIFGTYHYGTNDADRWYHPPSPHTLQNIDNKETARIFPRKIFHPKELDIKILIRKELLRKIRPILELHWEEVVAK